ncbi:MAG: transporter substrate-binding domain-containing protein, partial [Clostridia bacterium]
VIIDEQPAKVFVEKNEELTILKDPFIIENYAIAVAKEKTDLKKSINDALATLKNDGTLQKIIDNYIGENAGKTPYSKKDIDRSKGTLVMATNAEFPPYEFMGADQKVTGIDADMAQAVCDILGYELKIDNINFDSIIPSIQSGKADIGVAGMTVTEDRLKNIDFTDSYTTGTQVIIVRSK